LSGAADDNSTSKPTKTAKAHATLVQWLAKTNNLKTCDFCLNPMDIRNFKVATLSHSQFRAKPGTNPFAT